MLPKEEKGIWNSQGGEKNKHFFFSPSTVLSLTHKTFFTLSQELMITEQTIQFKLCTKDYLEQYILLKDNFSFLESFWLNLLS